MEEKVKVKDVKNDTSSISYKEAELVREFAKAKLEAKSELPYEELEGYELPPRTQFSMLNKPAMTVKYKEIKFNMACIKLFEGITHILPFVNSKDKKLAVIMRKEEGAATVEWARKKGDKYVNKSITSLEFTERLFKLMEWDRNRKYKILGHISNSREGLILVFELEEALMYPEAPEEFVDKVTGETKKRRVAYYPDMYKDRIGKTYSDYIAAEQMTIFECLNEYPEDATIPITLQTEDKKPEEVNSGTLSCTERQYKKLQPGVIAEMEDRSGQF